MTSLADVLRARGVARGLGIAPGGFDRGSTILSHSRGRGNSAVMPATLQPAQEIQTSIVLPGASAPRDWTPPELPVYNAGAPAAEVHVGDARRSQSPTVADDASTPPPPVREEFLSDPALVQGGGVSFRLSFGWPWWIWATIGVGGAIGVYALTRR